MVMTLRYDIISFILDRCCQWYSEPNSYSAENINTPVLGSISGLALCLGLLSTVLYGQQDTRGIALS
jgi:hypothetical protein